MINFDNKKNMYDMFIDKKVLTTKELLSVGFTNKDLTRLVETGKIRRVKRGFYELENALGLFKYTQILFSKRYKNYDRAVEGLKRCLEIEPENGSMHTRMFLNSVVTGDFEQALKSFEVMDKTEKENYKRDQNLWLFLLSFVVELPDEYKSRVKNMKLSDMLTLEDDLRYSDRLLQNRIRNAIYKHNFKEAQDLSKTMLPNGDRKIFAVITEKLLSKVIYTSVREHDYLYDLIVKCNYEEAEKFLSDAKEMHGINPADEQFLFVLRDLICILNEKKIPEVDTSRNAIYFNGALLAHNYEKLLEIYRCSAGRKTSRSSKFMGILLERLVSEISKLKLVNDMPVVKEVVVAEKQKSEHDDLFATIAASLMGHDVDTAFGLLDEYLASIDKSNFRGYVADLIKLSILRKDMSFSEPILLLSELSRDEFDFNIATYIQDFYFSVARKKFKEAAIFLDILSMSEQLGGITIPTYDLKEKLIEDAAKEGITREELGIKQVVEDVTEEGLLMEKIDCVIESSYSLTDVFDDVLENNSMVMLEPMSGEEIKLVVDTAKYVPKIQTIIIEETTGEKRVVLRYYDKQGPYIDVGATLKAADQKYKNWEYEDAIELYQSVLPKLETPKSFIFSRLGNCYRKTTYDGDFSKAIDYYTMAMAQNSNEGHSIDFSALISELKNKNGYNGVKVEVNDSVQYKKEYN